jgi:small subunit ribosomal protein S1
MTPTKKIAPRFASQTQASSSAESDASSAQKDLGHALQLGESTFGGDPLVYEDAAGSEEDEEENDKKRKAAEFARLLEGSFKQTQKRVSQGDRIKSEILSIGKEEVYVSTGTMHDGVVRRQDLIGPDGILTVQVGDRIDLYVTHVRGSEISLSPKAGTHGISEDLEDAFDKLLPVEGRVVEVCKGGFRVSILGKLAFCPISQMDAKRIEAPEEYVGQRFEFLITQLTERNLVNDG